MSNQKIQLPKGHYLFSSESVTEGHPDKICDQISDAVLDSILADDPNARVACETIATTGMVLVMGEISTTCYVDVPGIARQVLRGIGYDKQANCGFDADACAVLTMIDEQSADINLGVSNALETRDQDDETSTGAGDQGMMFGYACDETDEKMPLSISIAHKLCKRLTDVRKSGDLPLLRPDGKSQVTVEYDENDQVVRIHSVVVSVQHHEDYDQAQLREDIIREVIRPIVPAGYLDVDTRFYVNPTGRFVIGGPMGDSGLTGRKIIVDTYGGRAGHGGGCFQARIRQRWIARPRTWRATWRRTLWRRDWLAESRFNSPIQSVSLIPCRSWSIQKEPAPCRTTFWSKPFNRFLI